MNKTVKIIILAALFLIFILGAYIAYQQLTKNYKPQNALDNINKSSISQENESKTQSSTASDATQSEKEKIPAPDFTIRDIDGKELTLSDFKDKPIIINFWATWCGYCKEEMPYFDTAYLKYKDEVQFIMLDAVDGQRETEEKAKKFIEDKGYSFPIYFDIDGKTIETYGVTGFPSTLFIDREGNVLAGQQGIINEETLIAGIEALIKTDESSSQ